MAIKGRNRWFWIGWAILAAGFASILTPLNVPRFVRIIRHEASTTGVVTGTDCDNHASVIFSFGANGTTYTGGESRGDICSTVKPGTPITVYYSAQSPKDSVTREPAGELWNEIICISLVCLLGPPIILSSRRR